MRIFMLGWEFPPFISGGLGTACYGLTRAMDQLGLDVTFFLPKMVENQYDSVRVKDLFGTAFIKFFDCKGRRNIISEDDINGRLY